MENFLNPSPNGLSTNSPFVDGLFEAINFDDNIFSKNIETKQEEETPEVEAEVEVRNPVKKRINDYDANILSKYTESEVSNVKRNPLEFFKNLNFETIKNLKFEHFKEIFYVIFPGIYRTKMVKESLKRLVELNKATNELVTKKIPYGEGQEHYSDLISSISAATNIQAELKKRM